MDLSGEMSRTAKPGAGRRHRYLPDLQLLSPATTGSTHWVEGTIRSNKWDYTNPQPVRSRLPPNHVRASEWTRRHDAQTVGFQEALRLKGAQGDSLNVDSLLLDRPGAVNMPVEFDRGSPLHVAAIRGHSGLTQLLIHRGANTNGVNYAGQTSLHAAAEANQGAVVMDLLIAGADADRRDHTGQTPLHRAAHAGALDALVTLLDYGADLRVRDQGGLLAVHKAASMGRSEAIAYILQRSPASVNVEAASGWTALHLSAHGGFPAACETLLNHGADVAALDAERMQPLHRAAAAGCEATCQVLLRAGADVGATDIARCTPLHTACEEGSLPAARALLEAGAQVGVLDGMRRTPLLITAEAGQYELCVLLLQFGAQPTARDISKGVPSALDVARRSRHAALVALFEAAAAQAQVSSALPQQQSVDSVDTSPRRQTQVPQLLAPPQPPPPPPHRASHAHAPPDAPGLHPAVLESVDE